jgi:hypothetical protein
LPLLLLLPLLSLSLLPLQLQLQLQLLLPLFVLAVILSEAKDPEAFHIPTPLEPFNQQTAPIPRKHPAPLFAITSYSHPKSITSPPIPLNPQKKPHPD